MGHAHHFLSRLDRVSLPHVERALELYRDERLVQYVLGRSRLPDGAPRAAISLGDPVRGPFLVVTRDGKFVTCLAEGMSAGDLPIVTSIELEGATRQVEEHRARDAMLREVAPALGGTTGLLERLFSAADDLSREEVIAMAAVAPLFRPALLDLLLRAARYVDGMHEVLLPELKRSCRLQASFAKMLHPYYAAQHALGHLLVLAAFDGAQVLGELGPKARDFYERRSWTLDVMRQGVGSATLRAYWSAARVGKPLLAAYKGFRANAHAIVAMDAGLGLIALGARHAKLHAEVQKALAQAPSIAADQRGGRAAHLALKVVTATAALDPDEMREIGIKAGRALVMVAPCKDAKGSAHAYERPEDVPESIALGTLIWHSHNYFGDRELQKFCLTLPWVARAKVEDLYLPRDFIRGRRRPWAPSDALAMLKEMRDVALPSRAVPRPEVSRNGPCPCKSGKKYKRCCGASVVA